MNLCGLTTCRFNKDNICTSEADFGICRKVGEKVMNINNQGSKRDFKQEIINKAELIANSLKDGKDIEIRADRGKIKLIEVKKKVVK